MSSPATQIFIPSNVKLIKNLICTQWKNRSRVESSKKWTIYIGWLFSTFQNEFNHFHPANYISRIIYWANDVADSLFYLIYLFGSSVIKMFTSIYMLIISESLFLRYPQVISCLIFPIWINSIKSYANEDCIMGFWVCVSVCFVSLKSIMWLKCVPGVLFMCIFSCLFFEAISVDSSPK